MGSTLVITPVKCHAFLTGILRILAGVNPILPRNSKIPVGIIRTHFKFVDLLTDSQIFLRIVRGNSCIYRII